jgi:RimJ/RimL family protein N-acetyltransferase
MDVRLEPMAETHLGDIEALTADPEVLRFTRIPTPVPDGFAQGWIDRYAAARPEGTADGFAALDADGTFLGLALVPELDRAGRQAELGYIVAPAARGRGAGTAILRELTRWAFEDQGLVRVHLIIDTANRASQIVAARAGYEREGVMRSLHVKQDERADCELWSMLADEFPRPGRH